MKPTDSWINDWYYGEDPIFEKKMAEGLLVIFQGFWEWADLEKKSKSTQQRYSSSLHMLGGYLVEEVGNGHRGTQTIHKFLESHIDSGDGPLIHHDNELWQNEIDTACRKLYKYLIVRRS